MTRGQMSKGGESNLGGNCPGGGGGGGSFLESTNTSMLIMNT